MFQRPILLALPVCVLLATGCATPDTFHSGERAQLFDEMGPYRRTITTSSAEAQEYFDQGLTWMYAFNHDEAIRSFARAAIIDPECAMAWWAVALCEGPNYNDAEMTDERSAAAWAALQQALATIGNTTPVERALIEALAERYAMPWPEDRSGLDLAYAGAMSEVWADYPDDLDVGTLYAESMMVQMPWKLYSLDYDPAPDTPKIVATLERVQELEPDHPGANHLYIHAVEPSSDPDRGIAAADRLSDLVPASGHLEHMPSHIYVKTGRWERAIIQNEKALAADEVYTALSPEQRIQWGYMIHNAHMLAFAAMMSGREDDALRAAREMWSDIPPDALEAVGPFFDGWMCSIYDVQKRFGRWDGVLSEPHPPKFLPITVCTWHAARAVAYAAKKDFMNAEREYGEFRRAKAALPADATWGDGDGVHRVLEVSDYFIPAEIALQKGDWDVAAELLVKAAEVEDTLSYGEPPQWLQPVRHTLGAVYMKASRYAEAELAYREDLAKWRENGWSLYGLSRALEAQGKTEEAREVMRRYDEAWAKADAAIVTSCKCIPEV